MAANTAPIFVITPNALPVVMTVANTASDGSGTIYTVSTAGTNGTRVDTVVFRNSQATVAASSAMLGKIFLTDAAGANPRLIGEVAIAATTRSATVIGATTTFTFSPPLFMASGQILKTAISVRAGAQDDTTAIAYGANY